MLQIHPSTPWWMGTGWITPQVLTTEIGDSCCSVFLQSFYFPSQLKFHWFTPTGSRRKIQKKKQYTKCGSVGMAVNGGVLGIFQFLICLGSWGMKCTEPQTGLTPLHKPTSDLKLIVCVITHFDHRFKLFSSIWVLRKVILSSCFDNFFAIPWTKQVAIM